MNYYKLLKDHYGEVIKYDGQDCYEYRFGVEEWVKSSFSLEAHSACDNVAEAPYKKISESEAFTILDYQRVRLNRLLNLAVEIATKAHKGQVDKGGNPYINHPTAVAESVKDTEEKIVAYLHDVIEDTDITLEDLKIMGFTKPILTALERITKEKGVSYDKYLEGVREDRISLNVKIADIKNNMDLSRIKKPTQKDFDRVEKYKKALDFLER